VTARAFAVTVSTSARRALADRGGLAFTVGFYVLVTVVITTLWRAAADANGGAVAGYSALAVTWYLATSEAATVALNIRLIEDIGDDIADGSVAVELLRPASVLAVRVAAEIGRALPRLAALALIGVALACVVAGAPADGVALALAAPSLLLAIVANLLAQHAFAAAAFWVRDARSTWFLYQKLVFVLGGMLLPLEVLPAGVEGVARALPFMAMAYAPSRLASGHVEPELLAIQAGWVVVLGVLATAAFGAGERRLQVVGG
jgi:ABC-2 type transport system permease protein